jgi:TolB protein
MAAIGRQAGHRALRSCTGGSFPAFLVAAGLAVVLVSFAGAEEPFRRLTHDGHLKQRPVWSPDGAQLVFARHGEDAIFLYLLDTATGQEQRLTDRKYPEYDAVFSPDGKHLLLAIDNATPNQGDIDVHQLTLADKKLTPIAVTEGNLSHEEWPSWSPDGKRIAFTSTRDGNPELYVADADGKNRVRLTSDPAIDAHPCWSPDGRTIVFATNRWGDLELALIEADGSRLRRFTEGPGLDDYPAYSPDGTRIAFTSNRGGALDIVVADVATGTVTHLTRDDAIDNFPSWTPDGRITFVSNRGDGFDVYVTESVQSRR